LELLCFTTPANFQEFIFFPLEQNEEKNYLLQVEFRWPNLFLFPGYVIKFSSSTVSVSLEAEKIV
jgi:hypothetical protein